MITCGLDASSAAAEASVMLPSVIRPLAASCSRRARSSSSAVGRGLRRTYQVMPPTAAADTANAIALRGDRRGNDRSSGITKSTGVLLKSIAQTGELRLHGVLRARVVPGTPSVPGAAEARAIYWDV